MTVTLDTVTRKKLLLVVQLYSEAVAQSSRRWGSVSGVMAVVGFDLATETALKAVIGALDSMKAPSETFTGLTQQANTLLVKHGLPALDGTNHVLHVHSIRNDAQHKGRYPSESEVADSRIYTRDFLSDAFLNTWGAKFDQFSLVDLIKDVELANSLRNANGALECDHYVEAVKCASCALSLALDFVTGALVGGEPSFVEGIVVKRGFDEMEVDSDLLESFKRLRETSLRSVLGIDLPQYMAFRAIAGTPIRTIYGQWHQRGISENIDRDDAEFAIGYSTNTIVSIETLVGDIRKPFGREYWEWY